MHFLAAAFSITYILAAAGIVLSPGEFFLCFFCQRRHHLEVKQGTGDGNPPGRMRLVEKERPGIVHRHIVMVIPSPLDKRDLIEGGSFPGCVRKLCAQPWTAANPYCAA